MPTIKDVAKHCGLSTATVSAVVNNADWVPEETRARVQRAIAAVGYQPNRLARSLKTGHGYGIGVIVHDLTNPFFTEIVRSFSHALREHDRTFFLCDSDRQFDVGARNLQMLLEKQVDGLVLINDAVEEKTLRTNLRGTRPIPVVSIDCTYAIDSVHHLLVDSEKGAYEATTHLIEQGCQRVATITGPLEGPSTTGYGRLERYNGYRRALEEAALPFDPELVAEGNFHSDGGERAAQRLLSLDEPPEAIFAANDLMALGAMRAAQKAGCSIPGDLAMVGYDDIPMAEHVSPALTTIAMPKHELGRAAAELLHQRIQGDDGQETVRRMFAAELVVRDSSLSRSAKEAAA